MAALAASAQKLPDDLRIELAMTQRDIRELERNFLDLRLQFETESRKLVEKNKELVDKFNGLKTKAAEICKQQGGDFDEVKLECKPKANESRNE